MTKTIKVPVPVRDTIDAIRHDIKVSRRNSVTDPRSAALVISEVEALLDWVEEATGLKEERERRLAMGRKAFVAAQEAEAEEKWNKLDDHTKHGWIRYAENANS